MSNVISEEQRELNKALHANRKDFGNREDGAGLAGNLSIALTRMHELGICNSVLDYGTGKGKLIRKLQSEMPNVIKIKGYDPAVEEWKLKPKEQVDILISLMSLNILKCKALMLF